MKISEEFPSKYLKAADLQGNAVRLRISHAERAQMMDGETKPCLHFASTKKLLVLNKTNANEIVDAYGDDTEGWIGKELLLSPTRVEFQGKKVNAIRVSIPAAPAEKSRGGLGGAVESPKTAAEPLTISEELDDEIPF